MKIVVIGVTGMLGHKILDVLAKKFTGQVYGTLRGSKQDFAKYGFVNAEHLFENVDVENFSSILPVLENLKPDYVVNCTGVTLRKAEHGDVLKNFKINSYFPRALSVWCEAHAAKLIHFSTDCVFDGKRGNYRESDVPNATDVYGESKFLGESLAGNGLTLRVSIVGRELAGKTELLEWFLAQKQKTIKGFSAVFYSGLTTLFLANEVARIIKNFPQLSGLYQISSEPISKYDLLVLANTVFENKTEIQKDPHLKSDKTLNCDRYVNVTKFKKPQWKAMLEELKNDSFKYSS